MKFKKTINFGIVTYDTAEGTFEGRGGTAEKLRIAKNRDGNWDLMVRFEGEYTMTKYITDMDTKRDAEEMADRYFGWVA